MLKTIISGGQTGVDRGALDAALAAGVDCGGWCPRGRRAEDGRIPDRYPLRETPSANFISRTRRNVEAADATLVLCRGRPGGGTRATIDYARRTGRPVLVLRFDRQSVAEMIDAAADWAEAEGIAVLNVAGPRESGAPGIGAQAAQFVAALISRLSRS